MPKEKRSRKELFKWVGKQVDCYYDTPLLGKLISSIKFYHAFTKHETHYSVGDFAVIQNSKNCKLVEICGLRCLFEEGGITKAVVNIYKFASTFKETFAKLNIEIDEDNDVVLDSTKEIIINLESVVQKCRIIVGSTNDSVSQQLDAKNLNRKLYFLCRFQYIRSGDLVPALNGLFLNSISLVESTNETEYIYSPRNKTPLKLISGYNSPCVKKFTHESMDTDPHTYHLDQVKRNLSCSFDDYSTDNSNTPLNYSVIQSSEKDLKIKLRVSNGKVLSNLPKHQPIVLLDPAKRTPQKSKEGGGVYEVRSPTKKANVFEEARPNEVVSETSKLHDLSNMVGKLKITKSPSPRKLRKLSYPSYAQNFSDSDNENYPERRKSLRTRKKINYEEAVVNDIYFPSRRKSIRHIKSSKILESSEDDSTQKSPKAQRIRRTAYDIKVDDKKKIQVSHDKFLTKAKDSQCNVIDMEAEDSEEELQTDYVGTDSKTIPKRKIELSKVTDTSSKSRSNELRETVSITTTPKQRKSINARITSKTLKNTPLKLIREGILTPSIDQRRKSIVNSKTPLVLARNNLHVSYVPLELPCREKEYLDVYNFIKGKLLDKCGGCMYISGVPGTGKTATVTVAIENITKYWKDEGFTSFNYININGMRLTEPRQCYVEIMKQLTGKRIPWEQALSSLEDKFCIRSNKKVVPTVLVVDELDILCTKRQDVVYNLLDWPTKTNAQLIVVTIANTMDLPERLLISRVTSRLGLTRLTFQAYTYKQLQEIVVDRLTGNNSFKADAIQFVARKVASVSGDARRALDICRRSAEIAETEGPNTQVSMKHVNAALEAMITQPKVKAIMHCSRLEKLLLQSVIAEVERSGLEETVFSDVYRMLISLAALEGFKMVSVSLVSLAVYKLSSCRLLLVDQKCDNLNQRIILNVSADDVYYALKKD